MSKIITTVLEHTHSTEEMRMQIYPTYCYKIPQRRFEKSVLRRRPCGENEDSLLGKSFPLNRTVLLIEYSMICETIKWLLPLGFDFCTQFTLQVFLLLATVCCCLSAPVPSPQYLYYGTPYAYYASYYASPYYALPSLGILLSY